MARSARQVERGSGRGARAVAPPPPLQVALTAVGGAVARNPAAVGGTTAFLVALFYVSANALWYQPHAHLGTFFATRDFARDPKLPRPEPETTFLIERPEAAPRHQPSDPMIAQVQSILAELNFYDGAIDGIAGPATTKAIVLYQQKVGLAESGRIDNALLEQLGAQPTTASIPTPAPRETAMAAPQPGMAADADARMALNRKIQAGLKAFGNEDMEIDGVIGSRTKAAIKEFQALFGLAETGEPNEEVHAKMREIGLTN